MRTAYAAHFQAAEAKPRSRLGKKDATLRLHQIPNLRQSPRRQTFLFQQKADGNRRINTPLRGGMFRIRFLAFLYT